MTKTIHVLCFLAVAVAAAFILAPILSVLLIDANSLLARIFGGLTANLITVLIAASLLFVLIGVLIYSLIRDHAVGKKRILNTVLIAVGILHPFHDFLDRIVPSAALHPIKWTASIIACVAILAFFAINESELKKLSRATLLLLLSANILSIPFMNPIVCRILDVCLPFIIIQ